MLKPFWLENVLSAVRNFWKKESIGKLDEKAVLLFLLGVLMIGAVWKFVSLAPVFHAQAFPALADNQAVSEPFLEKKEPQALFADNQIDANAALQDGFLAATGKNEQVSKLETELYSIVGENPIREMIPHIAKEDQRIAALIVGIAKKESDWGNHSPSKDGQTCYNYWGYKGAGSRGTAMGYACFATAQEGVEKVGGRIGELVDKNLKTPSQFVVWKCGSSCSGHDPGAVAKWITDVDQYFRKVISI